MKTYCFGFQQKRNTLMRKKLVKAEYFMQQDEDFFSSK